MSGSLHVRTTFSRRKAGKQQLDIIFQLEIIRD